MFKNFLIQNFIYIKFVIAGSIVTTIDILGLYLLHGVFLFPLVFSVFLSSALAFFVSFTLQRYWTFFANKDNVNSGRKQLFMYFAVSIINIFLNTFFVKVLVNYQRFILNDYLFKLLVIDYNIWYLISQAVVCGAIGIESFLVYRYIIFKKI